LALSPSLLSLIQTFPDSDRLTEAIGLYMAELHKWNQRINLVSRKEGDLSPHFEDSLHFARALPEGAQVVDVGSGGGFPGLVTQIARPDCRVTLFEPVLKKVAFLTHIAGRLAPNAGIRGERMEPDTADHFGHAVCKAFTDLDAWETLMAHHADVLWFLASDPQAEARGPGWEIVTSWHHETHGARHLLRKIPALQPS